MVAGLAYAVTDVDNPGAGVLAVALRRPDGWAVAKPGGVVVGERLDQRRATKLMLRAGAEVVATAVLRGFMARQPLVRARAAVAS